LKLSGKRAPVIRENDPLPAGNSFEFWEGVSKPVLQVLEEPRDWTFLNEWCTKNRFGQSKLRQAIAWLENRGKAISFTRVLRDPLTRRKSSVLYWVKREWLQSHESQLRS